VEIVHNTIGIDGEMGISKMSAKSILRLFIPIWLLATVAGAQTGGSLTEDGKEHREGTIVVDVWSSAAPVDGKANQPDPAKLSKGFAAAALNAAGRMQSTERRIEHSIRMGFPLGGFWIQSDFDWIDESLRTAGLSATSDADRTALQELENQNNRLRLWSDWLIASNRNLRLAEYYISPTALDNDERFQNTVTCTKFLMSMLASGRLGEDNSCR